MLIACEMVVATAADAAAKQREEILAVWARVLAGEWTPAAAEDAEGVEGTAGEGENDTAEE